MYFIDDINVIAHREMITMMTREVLTALDSSRDYGSIPIHFNLLESEEACQRCCTDNAPALYVSWCWLPNPFDYLLAATIMTWLGITVTRPPMPNFDVSPRLSFGQADISFRKTEFMLGCKILAYESPSPP
jgi:hypothetical protein